MKKIISFVLLAAFICATVLGAGSYVFSALLGDVNGDTEIDNKDVVTLFRFVSGTTDNVNEENCDVNRDGSIDNKDVVALFRAVSAGLTPTDTEEESSEPAEESSEEGSSEEESSEEISEQESESESEEEQNIEYAKEFTVSRAVGKDMVIQRNEPIRIWGWAPESEEGKYVRAEFSGLSGKAKIEDGAWMITLDGTLPACTEPKNMTVSGDGFEKSFKNILVGDVYWVAGQSNIEYTLAAAKAETKVCDEARNVEISNDLQIRLYRTTSSTFNGMTLGTNDVSEDVVSKAGWYAAGKSGIASQFSALGYFTAVKLYNALDRQVPIGMIEFGFGGCALHAFLPNEVRDELKVSTADANGVYSAPGSNAHASSYIYNLGMYAFQRLPIAGMIWYQGESDNGTQNNNCYAYAERFTAFVNYIRDKHDLINHDYPVYIVELPPIYINFDFATVRANMGTIPSMLSNAHICSTSDLWKDQTYGTNQGDVADNLHPYNKWEIAGRMTDIMLADTYKAKDIDKAEGPIVTSCEFSADGKTATVKFTNVGDGLKWYGNAKKGVKVLQGFSWTDPASVEITAPDTMVITSSKAMKRVVYNNARDNSFPETLTLCNSNDVPCAAWLFTR